MNNYIEQNHFKTAYDNDNLSFPPGLSSVPSPREDQISDIATTSLQAVTPTSSTQLTSKIIKVEEASHHVPKEDDSNLKYYNKMILLFPDEPWLRIQRSNHLLSLNKNLETAEADAKLALRMEYKIISYENLPLETSHQFLFFATCLFDSLCAQNKTNEAIPFAINLYISINNCLKSEKTQPEEISFYTNVYERIRYFFKNIMNEAIAKGFNYFKDKDFPNALSEFFISKTLYDLLVPFNPDESKEQITEVFLCIGLIYTKSSNDSQAIEYLSKSLMLINELSKNQEKEKTSFQIIKMRLFALFYLSVCTDDPGYLFNYIVEAKQLSEENIKELPLQLKEAQSLYNEITPIPSYSIEFSELMKFHKKEGVSSDELFSAFEKVIAPLSSSPSLILKAFVLYKDLAEFHAMDIKVDSLKIIAKVIKEISSKLALDNDEKQAIVLYPLFQCLAPKGIKLDDPSDDVYLPIQNLIKKSIEIYPIAAKLMIQRLLQVALYLMSDWKIQKNTPEISNGIYWILSNFIFTPIFNNYQQNLNEIRFINYTLLTLINKLIENEIMLPNSNFLKKYFPLLKVHDPKMYMQAILYFGDPHTESLDHDQALKIFINCITSPPVYCSNQNIVSVSFQRAVYLCNHFFTSLEHRIKIHSTLINMLSSFSLSDIDGNRTSTGEIQYFNTFMLGGKLLANSSWISVESCRDEGLKLYLQLFQQLKSLQKKEFEERGQKIKNLWHELINLHIDLHDNLEYIYKNLINQNFQKKYNDMFTAILLEADETLIYYYEKLSQCDHDFSTNDTFLRLMQFYDISKFYRLLQKKELESNWWKKITHIIKNKKINPHFRINIEKYMKAQKGI